jgi:hypothetical protein
MFLVCRECKKVYVDGKWLDGVPPLNEIRYTLCVNCGGEDIHGHGMVYMDKQRKQGNVKK